MNRILLILAVGIAALSLLVSLGGNVAVYKIATDNATQVEKTRTFQCLQKQDAREGIEAARQFLREHPNGTRDFSKAFIEDAIRDNEELLDQMAVIDCPNDPR